MMEVRPELQSIPVGSKGRDPKLSEIAQVALINNAEAVARGDIIEAWQSWYIGNRAIIEAAFAKFGIKPPVLTEDKAKSK